MLIKLVGGLGNQMFIYAFAKQLSLKGYPILLDATHYNDNLHPYAMQNEAMANKRGGGGRPTTFRVNAL